MSLWGVKANRKLIAALAGVGVLGSALLTVNVVTANLGLQEKIQSCFKRYTKGIEYKRYSVVLSKSQTDASREAISSRQIECAIGRLGFDSKTLGLITSKKEGRVDNNNFAILWNRLKTHKCLNYKYPITHGTDYSFGTCVQSKVSDTRLVLTIKAYR